MGATASQEFSTDKDLSRRRAFTMLNEKKRSGSTLEIPHERLAPRLSCPSYMTEYDVKQLMSRSRSNTLASSTGDSEEHEMIETMRQKFSVANENDNVYHHRSLSSTKSNGSNDSGVSSRGHSPPSSLYGGLESLPPYIPPRSSSFEEDENAETPIVSDLPTPIVIPQSVSAFEVEVKKKNPTKFKKIFAKRVFKRRTSSISEESRRRSKSLGAVMRPSFIPGDKQAPLFGSSLLNREWELVTVSEMCRRLSLDQEIEMPIPDGAATSQILDELMIRQIMDILPPRAEGYPWVNIYNSEKHGFSLTTMYRKMAEFDEDLSPVLLIIRDTKEHVFGAVVSSAIRPSDHFTGTGDSCLLWRFTGEAPHTRELRHYKWTGDNQFFVNSSRDSLSVGAGGGHNGLWLDADLNHGRSQRCDTFDNEPLSGDSEDFVIQFIEAYCDFVELE
ncbi:unnamed protein product [Caenorhabditis auriculariae]|uniref:Oxidation resistance protein 1 n=1 Tax=Caenorhabditis auriculariae TaxID=2777116 RepID=A0A8S1HUE7_9PELO|nr:unnamed protein product [Caenorhabditis auriculariae]